MTIALPRKQDKNLNTRPDTKPNRNQTKYTESFGAATGGAPLSIVASRALVRGKQASENQRPADPNYLAHDARNWLTVLQVYCDLLRTSGAVNSGYEPWIEELSSAVERGHILVASLLDSVERASDKRRDQGQPRIAPQHVVMPQHFEAPQHTVRPVNGIALSTDLSFSLHRGDDPAAPAAVQEVPSGEVPSLDIADAITRRQPMFEHLAGSRIHVEIDAPANSGKIAMPESEFERILQNLVSNAIEAMPGGGRLRIAVLGSSRGPAGLSHHPAAKTLLLRVSDTGAGIAPERLPAIFEPGVSSKGISQEKEHAGDSKQHGFGLAIVQDLTERAGGWVRVQSQPGQGSCFELEFPRI